MSSLGIKDVDFGEHGVIYITSDKDRPLLTEWTKPATGELLRVLPKQFEFFNNGKVPSKRRLFDNCATHLERKGYSYTSAQCENKWKSLKRRYLTKYEKLLTGKSSKSMSKPRQMFDDEIEVVLKIEKPSFKREMDEISKINLNIPPGFSQKTEENDVEVFEEEEVDDDLFDYNEPEEHEYTQSDEKLVEMVLKDSNSMDEDSLKDNKNNVFANNIEYLFSNHDEAAEHSAEEKYIPHTSDHLRDSDRLVKEVRELRKIVKRSLDANTDILKTHNATHEQILICLDTLDKREEEKLDIKRKKLEKQGELVQQVKIQNSLIAKLIQKLGSSNSSNNR